MSNPYQSLVPSGLTALLAGFAPLTGEMPNPARAVIYTVPPGYATTIASIDIFNNSGGAATATIYFNTNGVAIPAVGAGSSFTDQLTVSNPVSRQLQQGSKIEAMASVAAVYYTIQLKETPV